MNESIAATDLAWAAGVIDSDGSIFIKHQRPNARGPNISPSYRLTVKVATCIWSIPARFWVLFGGPEITADTPRGRKRKMFRWEAGEPLTAKILEAVRPYLIGKSDQAWLGLEFVAQKTAGVRGIRLSEEELALREGFYLALKESKE